MVKGKFAQPSKSLKCYEHDCRMNDGEYVINLDDKQSKGTHWVSSFIDRNTAMCFNFFGIKYIPQEILSKIKDQLITLTIFRKQSDDYIMCGFY